MVIDGDDDVNDKNVHIHISKRWILKSTIKNYCLLSAYKMCHFFV